MNEIFSVKDKVIVITGGTGVLGRGISAYLASQGAKVAILARREKEGTLLANSITEQGGEAIFLTADVLDIEALKSSRQIIIEKYGKIDSLINAAGGNMPGATIPPDKSLFDLDTASLRSVTDLNFMGTVLPTMVFAEDMAKSKSGTIVNFSSMAAIRPLTRVAGYGAAKAAVTNFTKYLSSEMAIKYGDGVRVNAIAPGFFLTEQNYDLLINKDGSHTDRSKAILSHTPFGRFGKPEELYGTIQYLISEASKFVTGTVAIVDGGFDAFSL